MTHTETVTTTRTVTTHSPTAARACMGGELGGTFSVVPGSAGAGQIGYALTLKNTSRNRCYVHGLPRATLLSASGAPLPTRVAAAGSGATGRVVLEPGAATVANARFSPDVPGPGDSQTGACQPPAHILQVIPDGGGVVDAAIQPPTSVCERGTLNFEAFGYAG